MLNGDGVAGIDLDGCIDADGAFHEIAQDLLGLRTYTELSPSGRGLHAFIKATIAKPRKISAKNGVPGHEIYDGRSGSARFLTVTGNRVGEASELRNGPEAQAALDAFVAKWFPEKQPHAEVGTDNDQEGLNDDQVLAVMFGEKGGAKWRVLFNGNHSAYPSQSEADFALCRKLRFYTRANATQMDRLFRQSGLMRPKWDEKHGTQSYGEGTIKKALALGDRLYSGPPPGYFGEASAGQFAIIHRSVLAVLSSQNRREILTYIALSLHQKGGECYPSAARIAVLTGTTREHAQHSISKLTAAGAILKTSRPGMSSIFRLPAFQGVSNFDTGVTQQRKSKKLPRSSRNGRLVKAACRTQPVSRLDTPPVSNLDTQNILRTENKHRREGEVRTRDDEGA